MMMGTAGGGGSYYGPSYGASTQTSDFPDLAGGDSVLSGSYAGPSQRDGERSSSTRTAT